MVSEPAANNFREPGLTEQLGDRFHQRSLDEHLIRRMSNQLAQTNLGRYPKGLARLRRTWRR